MRPWRDVYKRQVPGSVLRGRAEGGCRVGLGTGDGDAGQQGIIHPAVSYTHLDVYKRQVLQDSPPQEVS